MSNFDDRRPIPLAGRYAPDEVVGTSAEINFVKGCIDRVAPTDATTLITGETGTGKELFARRLYQMSKRQNGPLISINCGAIPEALLESELFGFDKGAFTGAVSRQDGHLFRANGGTIFLDEVGELSLPAQAKLLRVFEEKAVYPLGARESRPIDVRIVAATNRDLEQLTAEQKFREDLLFRINVIHIHVPPLRERQEDIVPIAAEFLRKLSLQYQRPTVTLEPAAQCYLMRHPWFGNARELRNVMERTANDPSTLISAVRKTVRRLDDTVPVHDIKTQRAQINELLFVERLLTFLACGILALTLTSIGLYGLLCYQVARRTHEIGIRIAIGAEPRKIQSPILREMLTIVIMGLAIGVPIALIATRALAGMLYRIGAKDPTTLAGAIVLTLAVAAVAGYLPARRASHVDPMVSLRQE